MKGQVLLTIFLTAFLTFVNCSWSWERTPRWADVYFRGPSGFEELDHKLEWLMDHYDIISLEKCLSEVTMRALTWPLIDNIISREDPTITTQTGSMST